MREFISKEHLICAHWTAKKLGVAERTVRHWANTGVLPAIRLGEKLWMFRPSDIDEFKTTKADRIRPRHRARKHGGEHVLAA
jgi:excisionase family DNA binding protein